MERGLLWLPLLAVFIGLAWAGWNEYQKVEAYRQWATQFQRAKYDIYAVLGQKDSQLTWGRPTRQGPTQVQTLSLDQVAGVELQNQGKTIALALTLADASTVQIPFTEMSIATEWAQYLQQNLQRGGAERGGNSEATSAGA